MRPGQRPIGRLKITFNAPLIRRVDGSRRPRLRTYGLDDEPRITGELLLAGLKENA